MCVICVIPEHRGLFVIDPSTGRLKQVAVVDREVTGDVVVVAVTATDKDQPPKSITTKIDIKINDIDDHLPHFTNGQIKQEFGVTQVRPPPHPPTHTPW